MATNSVSARRSTRRVWFLMGILAVLLLLLGGAFLGGRAMAYGTSGHGTSKTSHSASCKYNASHQLISGPSYCAQSNWVCKGVDIGSCVNGKQEVEYSGNCPTSIKYLGCTAATQLHAAPSRFVSCSHVYHMAWFRPWRYTSSGGQVPNGNIYLQHYDGCTANPPNPPTTKPPAHCTPNGTLTLHFLGCVGHGIGKFDRTNSCGSVVSTHDGKATRCDSGSSTGSGTTPTQGSGSSGSGSGGSAPSCTVSTTYSNPVWTGCSAKGQEIGYQHWSRTNSCTGTTSGNNTVGQHTSSTCQPTIRHQCAYAKPGYAQSENCLTSPQGGYADCKGWSTPYYDTYDCPIPTPIGTY